MQPVFKHKPMKCCKGFKEGGTLEDSFDSLNSESEDEDESTTSQSSFSVAEEEAPFEVFFDNITFSI